MIPKSGHRFSEKIMLHALVNAHRFELMALGVARRFRKAVRDGERGAVGGVQDEHRQARDELRRLRIEDFGLFGAHLPDIADRAFPKRRERVGRQQRVASGSAGHGTSSSAYWSA